MIMAAGPSGVALALPSRRFFRPENRDGDAADVPEIDRLDGGCAVVAKADRLRAASKGRLLASVHKAETATAKSQKIGHSGPVGRYRLTAGKEDQAGLFV